MFNRIIEFVFGSSELKLLGGTKKSMNNMSMLILTFLSSSTFKIHALILCCFQHHL